LVEKIPFKAYHAVEFLQNLMASGKIAFKSGDRTRITLHDPCHFGKQHIGRRRDLYEETRQIIRAVPGIHFVEMENAKRWSACCGGGNSVTSTNTPEFTDYHSTKRCEEAEKIADVMLTPCVRCLENLSTAAKRQGKKISVRSLLEFASDMIVG
jgi:Fe-S oxidoreductase